MPPRREVPPPQVPPQALGEEVVTHVEFRNIIAMLAQANALKAPNPASRVRDFIRMDPPSYYGDKVDEDPQEFIEEVDKVLEIMGVNSEEKAELAAYQLRSVAQIWYKQWKEGREDHDAQTWDEFRHAFLYRFFPLELREAKMKEFLNLKQGSMSVKEYALKFTKLSKHAPHVVADPRLKMSLFISGVSDLIDEECQATMLLRDMDFARLATYAEQMEEKKKGKEEKRNEAKRTRVDDNVASRQDKGKGVYDPPKDGMDQNPTCETCGKKHKGKCLAGLNVCYKCAKPGHHARECRRGGARWTKGQAQGRQEMEGKLNVATGKLISLCCKSLCVYDFEYEFHSLLSYCGMCG